MRLSPSYRGARRNAVGPVWGAGPYNAINWRVRKPPLGPMFKTYTIVHSSYTRAK